MSTIANLVFFPMDKGEELADHVADVVKVIQDSGLPFVLGPMSTAIEGEYDEVMEVVRNCFFALKKNSGRIYMTLAIDYRESHAPRMDAKVAAVKDRLEM